MRKKMLSLNKSFQNGFTLLELLIVITILAILAVIVTFVLNPVETLRKSRDVQRMSDLATIKNSISLYMTTIASPDLDAAVANGCLGGTNTAAQIFYSKAVADATCTAAVAEGADVTTTGSNFSATDFCTYVASPNASVDGLGWLPVDLTSITGGSPISNYPVDPTNTVAVNTAPTSADFVYRYTCQQGTVSAGTPSIAFELNAILESDEFTVTNNKYVSDGGDNTAYYEVGTSLRLIGAGTNF